MNRHIINRGRPDRSNARNHAHPDERAIVPRLPTSGRRAMTGPLTAPIRERTPRPSSSLLIP
ncbi:hypothetical protein [Haloferax sp. ATB1]|uniref:hypothetical protein n=1 Tax=Haloferax sp. ATB1 TaxID=1508454 RepID=UPI000A83789F|nr:hypothetical protein [Haloferax sp. ATB1]